MKGLLQIVIGLLLWVGTLYLLTIPNWLQATLTLLRGGIVFGLFFIGLGVLLLGFNELKA
ncbi:hypothetical protein J4208_03785 [Candidatus Woesearchaeota archaeon]|nr:hypothetical protein [Candidatus Woesearchaeota archaeon]